MKKPVIAIAPQFDYEQNRVTIASTYLKAIRESGGVPFLLPLYNTAAELEELVEFADGFLFPGGPDVNPIYFNEEAIPECGRIVKERDSLELNLIPMVYKTKKPVLGICRGIQAMNIAMGGDIYQDLEAQFDGKPRLMHYQKATGSTITQHVHIKENTLLYDILKKDEIAVNSFHHQAVRMIAEPLTLAGMTNDGLTEAIYDKNHPFFLGVQWHPEDLYEVDEDARSIFNAFIKACIL